MCYKDGPCCHHLHARNTEMLGLHGMQSMGCFLEDSKHFIERLIYMETNIILQIEFLCFLFDFIKEFLIVWTTYTSHHTKMRSLLYTFRSKVFTHFVKYRNLHYLILFWTELGKRHDNSRTFSIFWNFQ